MNYYTADTHFFHTNIIKYCNRPFKDAEEMNEKIIENFNSVLTDEDTLYILGDIGMGKNTTPADVARMLGRIKGKKILIAGNHDETLIKKPVVREQLGGIHKQLLIKDATNYVFLCHYPMLHWDKSHNGSINLYGHIHNTEPAFVVENSYNVGVDVCDFMPLTLDQIIEKYKK